MAFKKKENIAIEEESIDDDNIREVIVEKKTGFNTAEVIVIIIVAILFGALIGSFLTYTKDKVTVSNAPKELKELVSTYNTLVDEYYNDLDKDALLESAIYGMVSYLDDPYSTFMDQNSTDEFNQTVEGQYVGIGVSVSVQDDKAIIVSMYDGSPAESAGLKTGDIIIKIEGEDITNKSLSKITSLIKGKVGTKVKITVLREEKEIEVTVTRSTIEIPSVASEIIISNHKKVGYISINVFASNTYKQFKKELQILEKEKINSLIIDVRGNPGGQLNQVTKILSLFIKKDKTLYQIKCKEEIEKIVDTTKNSRSYPIVVLQNSSSASASEILSAAFKETYKGIIIGTTSYGKGTVQKAQELSNGASFKYTVEEWLTPKGNSINEVGVKPTINIEISDEYKLDQSRENDNQLKAALEELTKINE